MRFNRFLSFAVISLTTLLSPLRPLEAGVWCNCWPGDLFGWGYLDLTNGYRRDKITSSIDGSLSDDRCLFSEDLNLTDIGLYQIGLQGKWTFCDVLFYIEGDLGWSDNGNFNHTGFRTKNHQRNLEGCLHSCQTSDFMVGTGYLFWPHRYFGIGPTVGWSYNYQRVKTEEVQGKRKRVRFLDDLEYKQRWQGPWAGVDAVFQYCRLAINVAYEYHWAHWHSSLELDDDCHHRFRRHVAFLGKRKSDHAHGNVVYLDAMWNFCVWWNIGLGFKYQYWKTSGGCVEPNDSNFQRRGSFKKGGFLDNFNAEVDNATWQSYDVSFDIGYTF